MLSYAAVETWNFALTRWEGAYKGEPLICLSCNRNIVMVDDCLYSCLTCFSSSSPLQSGKYARQYGVPIDPQCSCSTCQQYDRSYLWHLFKAKEPVFMTLATIHNLQYMNDLMAQQRQLIMENKI